MMESKMELDSMLVLEMEMACRKAASSNLLEVRVLKKTETWVLMIRRMHWDWAAGYSFLLLEAQARGRMRPRRGPGSSECTSS